MPHWHCNYCNKETDHKLSIKEIGDYIYAQCPDCGRSYIPYDLDSGVAMFELEIEISEGGIFFRRRE